MASERPDSCGDCWPPGACRGFEGKPHFETPQFGQQWHRRRRGPGAAQRLGIGPEELTWYSSLIASAWGKDCALLLGVRQLIVECCGYGSLCQASRITHDNSTCVLCRFFNFSSFWSKCWCAFLQLLLLCNSYQFMCSCVAAPQRGVAWFVEAWHCSLRAAELTAWVSCLVWLKSMYQTESLKAPTPWPNDIGGGSQVFRHVTQEMWTAARRFSKL